MKDTEKCMQYKCKVCPKSRICEKNLTHLTWRPFENLKEILDAKSDSLRLATEEEKKAN